MLGIFQHTAFIRTTFTESELEPEACERQREIPGSILYKLWFAVRALLFIYFHILTVLKFISAIYSLSAFRQDKNIIAIAICMCIGIAIIIFISISIDYVYYCPGQDQDQGQGSRSE